MLRIVLILMVCSLRMTMVYSQVKAGDNPLVIDDASLIEIESTSKGFLPSRMTSAQRDLQLSWEVGHIIYNLTESCLQIYNGTVWECFVKGELVDSTIYKYDGALLDNRLINLDGNNIHFKPTGQNGLFVEGDGDVGIGTTTPNAKLDVENGTVRLSDYGDGNVGGTGDYVLGVDADGDVIELSVNTVGSDDQIIDSLFIRNDSLLISLENDGEDFKPVDLSSYVNTDSQDLSLTGNTLSLSGDASPVDLSPFAVDSSIYRYNGTLPEDRTLTLGAYDLTFSGTNNVIFESSGELGIGQALPDAPLHITESTGTAASATDGSLILQHNDSGGASSLVFKSAVNSGSDFGYIQYEDDGSGNGSTTENALLTIGTQNDGPGANQDDIALLPSGNLGIGTISPAAKLDVDGGNVRFSNYGSGTIGLNTEQFILGVDTDGDIVEVDPETLGLDTDWLALGGGKADNILDTIYTFGNVGINRNSPQYPLHLDAGNPSSAGPWVVFEGGSNVRANTALQLYDKGTAANNEIKIEFAHNPNTSTATPLAFIRSNTVGTFHANGADLTLETKSDLTTINTDQLVLKNTGNIGVGTSAPDELLHVAGNMRLDGAFEDKDGDAGSLGDVLISTVTGTDWVSASTLGSDDQIIDSIALTGTDLEIGLEGDVNGLQTVDLSPLQGGSVGLHDDVDVTSTTPTSGDVLAWDGSNFVPQATDNGYTIFNVWAEESGSLDGTTEWAYGNGDNTPTGHGIVIPVDCELWAMSLDHEGGNATTVRVIQNSNTALTGYEVTTSGVEQGYNVFGTPLTFSAGDVINFQTISATPVGSSGRVSAWFRIRATPASNSLLEDLMDVSASGISTGQVLVYNGASFVPGDNSDDQKIDSFALNGNILNISLENDGENPLTVDLSTISGSSDNIYNTNGNLDAARTVGLNSNNLTFDGAGSGDVIIEADGDVGIGTTSPSARLDVQGGTVALGEYGTGAQADTTNVNYILTTNTSGQVKELNTAKNTRWFYPPAVIIDASDLDTAATLDIYEDYKSQFSMPLVSSDGASGFVPYYQKGELEYYVTYYDDTVLDDISIDADGVMTYDIISVPFDNYTVINVVFVIKDP